MRVVKQRVRDLELRSQQTSQQLLLQLQDDARQQQHADDRASDDQAADRLLKGGGGGGAGRAGGDVLELLDAARTLEAIRGAPVNAEQVAREMELRRKEVCLCLRLSVHAFSCNGACAFACACACAWRVGVGVCCFIASQSLLVVGRRVAEGLRDGAGGGLR